jgi:hypothetical protein
MIIVDAVLAVIVPAVIVLAVLVDLTALVAWLRGRWR